MSTKSDTVRIKFIKQWRHYTPGMEIEPVRSVADLYISQSVAELVKPPKKRAAKKQKADHADTDTNIDTEG